MNLTKTLGANLSLDVSIGDGNDEKHQPAAAVFKRASDLLESSLVDDINPRVTRTDQDEEQDADDNEQLRKQDPVTLAQELKKCRRKLADTEANYQKIKVTLKRRTNEANVKNEENRMPANAH